jgi:hypothetical protein
MSEWLLGIQEIRLEPEIGENGGLGRDVIPSVLIVHLYDMITPCLSRRSGNMPILRVGTPAK